MFTSKHSECFSCISPSAVYRRRLYIAVSYVSPSAVYRRQLCIAVSCISPSAVYCRIANMQNYTDDMFGLVHIQSRTVLTQKRAYRAAFFGTRNSIIAFKITGLRLLACARWFHRAPLHSLSQLCTQSVNHIVRCPSVFSSVCPAQIWEPVRTHFILQDRQLAVRELTCIT
jgi:hypothetical protein